MPHVSSPQGTCQFGIAQGDITPPVGIYNRMWGAAAHDRAEGVHRPVTASVMYFAAGSPEAVSVEAASPGNAPTGTDRAARQLVVALDHCVLNAAEYSRVVEAVADAAPCDPAAVTVVCSHTHAVGLMGKDREQLPGGDLIAGYLDSLMSRLAELSATAAANARQCDIVYGQGRCDLAAHRDLWDEASGQFVCGFNPDRPADDTVMLARISDHQTGQPVATVMNYACHPTTLAWDNKQISPDFPGAARETVERSTGAPCVFLQGASGDLGPREGFVGDTEVADRNGRQLGYAALSALESFSPAGKRYVYAGPVVSGATIGTWRYEPLDADERARALAWSVDRSEVPLAYRSDLEKLADAEREHQRWQQEEQSARETGDASRASDCRAMVERGTRLLGRLRTLPAGDAFPLKVSLWRIGDGIWLTVQGESYSVFQRTLRERFPGTPIIVAGIAENWGASYLPPADVYGQGIYQESVAVLAPGSLEKLIDVVSEKISRLLEG